MKNQITARSPHTPSSPRNAGEPPEVVPPEAIIKIGKLSPEKLKQFESLIDDMMKLELSSSETIMKIIRLLIKANKYQLDTILKFVRHIV